MNESPSHCPSFPNVPSKRTSSTYASVSQQLVALKPIGGLVVKRNSSVRRIFDKRTRNGLRTPPRPLNSILLPHTGRMAYAYAIHVLLIIRRCAVVREQWMESAAFSSSPVCPSRDSRTLITGDLNGTPLDAFIHVGGRSEAEKFIIYIVKN